MIKVGDKVIWKSEEWEVYRIEEHKVSLQRTENGFGIGTNVDLRVLESGYYKRLYEQQKQRADELEEKIDKNKRLHDAAIKSAGILFSDEKQRADRAEKRWSELWEHVTVRADMCKEKRMLRERNALIDVMAAMHDLEEENEG